MAGDLKNKTLEMLTHELKVQFTDEIEASILDEAVEVLTQEMKASQYERCSELDKALLAGLNISYELLSERKKSYESVSEPLLERIESLNEKISSFLDEAQ